uniref:Uncharacterized protein n=1 Tax=Glossina palpalis gambiensis TaxID=67801 RepID=A0A1B0AQ13_9MUSC
QQLPSGRDRLVVRTLRCGRSNPGSNPGHGNDFEQESLSRKYEQNDLPIIKARHEYRNEKEMFQKMFVTRKNLKIPKNLELKCEQAQSSKLWKALSTEQSAAEQWFTDKTFSRRCVKTFRQY